MTKTLPEIRISYAWLLAGEASVVMNEKYGDGTSLRAFDEYEAIVNKYNEWWSPHSSEILRGLCTILGLEFRQNIIDIYVAPWFNPISDPMVIGPAFRSEDSLLNTITHELVHRLLTDNTSIDYNHDFLVDWKHQFGENHDWNMLVHIPVHAVMKKLYLDVIDRPDLLELDIEDTRSNAPYADAWKYVNSTDYNELVERLSISKSS
jgi:hypothetical protein